METLEKLHAVERMATLRAILYDAQGVGLQFYEPGRVIPEEVVEAERRAAAGQTLTEGAWRKNLVVQGYYPTFEAAVDAEYDRLIVGTDAGWKLIHTNGWEP
jgi:hypothetical protein